MEGGGGGGGPAVLKFDWPRANLRMVCRSSYIPATKFIKFCCFECFQKHSVKSENTSKKYFMKTYIKIFRYSDLEVFGKNLGKSTVVKKTSEKQFRIQSDS